jgi:hypothetical protein
MLKKSLFSPAQPWRAKTHLSPSIVLASFRSSTETRPPHHSAAQSAQLPIEYDPQPPFDAGSPDKAPHPIVSAAPDQFSKLSQ